jgi:hypothetical protein
MKGSMKRLIVRAGCLAALAGWLLLGVPGGAHAAGSRDAAPRFLIGTLEGTAYAPDGAGMVMSWGVVGNRLTFAVHLRNLPQPGLLGGKVYKVWLVDPTPALAMPGGVLTYHADGTADGTFTSTYHDFTVFAVTAEMTPDGAYPQNDKVLEGSVDAPGLAQALAAVASRTGTAPIAAISHQTAWTGARGSYAFMLL